MSYFTKDNTVGHTADDLARMNRRYDQLIATYLNPDEIVQTGSDPHFFPGITVAEYVARQVLLEGED